jgi:hypothetical protein
MQIVTSTPKYGFGIIGNPSILCIWVETFHDDETRGATSACPCVPTGAATVHISENSARWHQGKGTRVAISSWMVGSPENSASWRSGARIPSGPNFSNERMFRPPTGSERAGLQGRPHAPRLLSLPKGVTRDSSIPALCSKCSATFSLEGRVPKGGRLKNAAVYRWSIGLEQTLEDSRYRTVEIQMAMRARKDHTRLMDNIGLPGRPDAAWRKCMSP